MKPKWQKLASLAQKYAHSTELSLTDDLQFWTPIFGAGTPIS